MVLESSKAKETLKKGALSRTRRALRSVSVTTLSFFKRAYQIPQSESAIPVVISSLVALVRSDLPQNPIHFISLIGVAVAVLVRLKHTTTPANERLPKELQVSSNCSNKLSTHGMHVRSKLLSFIPHSSSCPGHLFQFMFWYVWSWPFAIGDKNGWSSPL